MNPPSRVLARSTQEDTVTKEHAKMASIQTAQRWRGKTWHLWAEPRNRSEGGRETNHCNIPLSIAITPLRRLSHLLKHPTKPPTVCASIPFPELASTKAPLPSRSARAVAVDLRIPQKKMNERNRHKPDSQFITYRRERGREGRREIPFITITFPIAL